MASSAIAARFDLDKNGKNVGAIDAKVWLIYSFI